MIMIFISHRETDKEVADMLVDFFASTGIPKDKVFCSSLPGNKVHKKISEEVKEALKNSIIDIVILSSNYYQSAYCLNEAGIIWYKDKNIIPIALPEIDESNMYGFLNNDYILRRLDSDTDISFIYDDVRKTMSISQIDATPFVNEINKLKGKYNDLLKTREITIPTEDEIHNYYTSDLTTDDERIVLYCLLEKGSRKISKNYVTNWLRDKEIYDVDVDNAFDLLSSFDGGKFEDRTLIFGATAFREYSSNSESIMIELEKYVDNHKRLSVDHFKKLWKDGAISNMQKLLIAYIAEKRVHKLGSRSREDRQIESIKRWETNNCLDSTLSDNYKECLDFLVQNKLVYESDWTSYSNPREYTLYNSVKNFLFNFPKEYIKELNYIKDIYHSSTLDLLHFDDDELPF